MPFAGLASWSRPRASSAAECLASIGSPDSSRAIDQRSLALAHTRTGKMPLVRRVLSWAARTRRLWRPAQLSAPASSVNFRPASGSSADGPPFAGDEFGGLLGPCSSDHVSRIFALFGPLPLEVLPLLL